MSNLSESKIPTAEEASRRMDMCDEFRRMGFEAVEVLGMPDGFTLFETEERRVLVYPSGMCYECPRYLPFKLAIINDNLQVSEIS